MANLISIGKIVAVHGIKGELLISHGLGKPTQFKGIKALFIEERKGDRMPWFVTSAKARNEEETLVKLEGIDTPEAARKLNQRTVWLQKEDFDKQASSSAAISFIGYTIVNEGETLGEVIEVIEQPHQILCTVMVGEKEVYVPLHQDSLESVDKKNRIIHVVLPEGLLEIYLGAS